MSGRRHCSHRQDGSSGNGDNRRYHGCSQGQNQGQGVDRGQRTHAHRSHGRSNNHITRSRSHVSEHRPSRTNHHSPHWRHSTNAQGPRSHNHRSSQNHGRSRRSHSDPYWRRPERYHSGCNLHHVDRRRQRHVHFGMEIGMGGRGCQGESFPLLFSAPFPLPFLPPSLSPHSPLSLPTLTPCLHSLPSLLTLTPRPHPLITPHPHHPPFSKPRRLAHERVKRSGKGEEKGELTAPVATSIRKTA